MATAAQQTATTSTITPQTLAAASSSTYFPLDLASFPYFLTFSFYNYQAPGFGSQNSIVLADAGTVRLPLCNSLVEHQDVNYDQDSAGIVGAALAGAQGGSNSFENVINGAGSAAGYAAVTGLGNLGGDVVTQRAGVTINPFLTVLFKSPAYRTFSLSWKLIASNIQESAILNTICNTFRYNQLPDASGDGLFLQYPNICQVMASINDPTYCTMVFKPSVITSLQINWTAEGQPSFFSDAPNAPVSVELTINFMEIELWYASDYGPALISSGNSYAGLSTLIASLRATIATAEALNAENGEKD